MPAAFFIMLSASYPPALQVNPILIGSLFLVYALLILLKGEEHRAEPMSLFNATLIVAAGSLFYLKLLYFIPFLWITAVNIRPLKWRGVLNPLIVLAMMALFFVTYFWVFKDNLQAVPDLIRDNLALNIKDLPKIEKPLLILLGYLLFIIIITSGYLLSRFQFRKISTRKIYQLLFFLFIYTLLYYVLIAGYRTEMLTMIAIPLSFLFANFFHRRRNHWFHEVMIWIWILLLAYIQLEEFIFI